MFLVLWNNSCFLYKKQFFNSIKAYYYYVCVIAAPIDLGEEIAADAMDMQGDLVINSNSLAIKFGKPATLKISSYIFILVILLSVLPFFLDWFPIVYLVPIAIMDSAIAYPLYRLLKSQNDEGRKYIRWIYLGATLGLLIFIVMRFFDL